MMSSNNAAAVDEATFLQFGSSLNVTEDLRRSIKKETQDLEEQVDHFTVSCKSEQLLEAQQEKDLSHVHVEMSQHRQRVREQLGDATVKDHLRRQLANSLQVEFIQAFVKVTDTTTTAATTQEGKESSSDEAKEQEAADGTTKSRPSSSFTEHMAENKATFSKLSASLLKTKEELLEIDGQVTTVKEESTAIENQICAENLGKTLEESKQEVEAKTLEHQQENQRCSVLKNSLNKSRASIGEYTGSYADQSKILSSNKTAHAKKEDEALARQRQHEAEVQQLDGRAALKAKLESKAQNVQSLQAQISEFQALRKALESKKEETEQLLAKTADLTKSNLELKSKVEKQKEATNAAVKDLADAKALKAEADALRVDNDKVESGLEETGQTEMMQLQKQKEQLAQDLKQQEDLQAPEDEARVQKEKDQETELAKLAQEIKTVQSELEGKRTMRENLERAIDEGRQEVDKQLREHEQFADNFAKGVETEATSAKQVKAAAKKKREQVMQETRRKCGLVRDGQDRKLEILRIGAEKLAAVAKAERQNEKLAGRRTRRA